MKAEEIRETRKETLEKLLALLEETKDKPVSVTQASMIAACGPAIYHILSEIALQAAIFNETLKELIEEERKR